MLLLTGMTFSCMAISLAFVLLTGQYLLTFFTALESEALLAAFYYSLRLTTLASNNCSFIIAWFTLTAVASVRTEVWAVRSTFLATYLSAGMRS
jgi:hypothetical protein